MISRRVRLLIFFLCLTLYLLGAIGIYSVNLPAAVSPFLWITALLGGSLVFFIAVPALIIFSLGLIKKRFFCRFLCPMGCSFEMMEKAFRRYRKKAIIRQEPKHFLQWNYCGKAFVLLTLLCVMFRVPGVSGFQFLDPLILFGMFFNFQNWNPLIFLAIFLLLFSVFRPYFWCVNFCPLGAFQDMTHEVGGIITRHLRLKKRKELEKSLSDISQEEPEKDFLCARQQNAASGGLKEVTLISAAEQEKETSRGTGRRTFLLAIPLLFLLALGRRTVLQLQRTGRFFRPPGACGDEAQFASLCTSCGRCIAVCPTKHLISLAEFTKNEKKSVGTFPDDQTNSEVTQSTTSELGFNNNQTQLGKLSKKAYPGTDLSFNSVTAAGLSLLPSVYELTPVLETKSTFCDAKCNACSRVCPTGALRPFSIEKKKSLQIGIAKYEFDNCVLYNSKDCNICVRECPYEAIGLVWNEELYVNIPTVDPDKCTGCGRCIVFCPGFDPVWHGEENEEENGDDNDGDSFEQENELGNEESASDQNELDQTGSGLLTNSPSVSGFSVIKKSVDIKKEISNVPPKAFTIISREEWEAMSSPEKN